VNAPLPYGRFPLASVVLEGWDTEQGLGFPLRAVTIERNQVESVAVALANGWLVAEDYARKLAQAAGCYHGQVR
jgi:hypothetical protein